MSDRIFIVPRSGEQASKIFQKTIGGYKKSDIEVYLSEQDKTALQNESVLIIWGNKPSLMSRWERMRVNDWVLFYQKKTITYAGPLLYKTHNKALADALWGPQESENGEMVSWEYVFFLKDLREVNINYKVMADLAGYRGDVVQGFMPYSDTGVQNILTQYGSIENFLFKGRPMKRTTHPVYLSRESRRLLLVLIVFVALYFVFYQSVYDLIIERCINHFFNKTVATWFGDAFFGIVGFASLICIFTGVKDKKIDLDDFVIPFAITCVYVTHRVQISGQHWDFIAFKSTSWFTYADAVYLALIAATLNPRKRFLHTIQPKNSLLEDDLYSMSGNDIFKRKDYAKRIAQLINEQKTRQSFAISVTGRWGSGKTVFLRQVQNEIKESLIITFSPWLSKASSNILQDFFSLVIEKVQEFDKSLSKKLRKYSNTLLALEEKIGFKISKALGFGENSSEFLSLERQRRSIQANLEQQSIKLLVIIDDLDRLDGDEVLGILSLIRNTFNFPNVFFIVAFDYNYILKLVEEKKIPSPALFLEKIFQFDIDLPSFPTFLLKSQLLVLLQKGKSDYQILEIRNSMELIDGQMGLKEVITNLRECIRFANSFNHVYDRKYTEVDILDFILVELIKLKNKFVYQEIRDALSIGRGTTYLNFPSPSATSSNITFEVANFEDTDADQTQLLKNLLGFLFNRESQFDGMKALRVPGNAVRYFSDDLFGNISFEEFDIYKRNKEPGPFVDFLRKEVSGGREGVIRQLLPRVNQFATKEAFFNFNKGVLVFCNAINDFALNAVVYNLTNDPNAYGGTMRNRSEFYSLIYELLEPSIFPYVSEALFGGEI